MARILFTAQNAQEAEAVAGLIRECRSQGWAIPAFVSFDAFLRQGARSVVADCGVEIVEIAPRRTLRAPFYQLSIHEKLATVARNAERIAEVCCNADALVCCSDGALERCLIQRMKGLKRPNYLMLSWPILAAPQSTIRRALHRLGNALGVGHLTFSALGQGGCDRIFVPGRQAIAELMRRGVPRERIIVVGSTRFGTMMARAPSVLDRSILNRPNSEPLSLLYLMPALEWHGYHDRSTRHAEQLAELARCVRQHASNVRLRIRPHPRSSAQEITSVRALIGATVSDEPSIALDISATDVVIGCGSTGLYEAVALGRLAVHVDMYGVLPPSATRDLRALGIWSVESEAELNEMMLQLSVRRESLPSIFERERASLRELFADGSDPAARIMAQLREDLS